MNQAPLPSTPKVDDKPTFEAIYQAHFAHVWHTLRRLGVHERDLEDKVHDVFMVVHRRFEDFDISRRAKPWLTGITYRVASDYRRSARYKREVVKDEFATQADAGPGPERQAEAAQARRQVEAALEVVPLDQRVVVVMHDLNGVGIPDIARELGVSKNTLYSRLRLGREKFTTAVRAAAEGTS